MAQTILVIPEQLRSDASQVRACAEQDAEIIQKLTNLVLSLDEVWKGEAQTAFVKRFQSARTFFNSFNELLIAYSEMMESTAAKLENADQALQQRIAGIS